MREQAPSVINQKELRHGAMRPAQYVLTLNRYLPSGPSRAANFTGPIYASVLDLCE